MTNNNHDDDERSDIQRRDFLKKSSAAGAGIFGLAGFAGNVDAAHDADFEITGRSRLGDSEARSHVGDAMSWSYTRDLAQKMIQDVDLRPAFSNAFGVEFTTDDPKMNDLNPAAVSLPFVSPKGDRGGLLVMAVADSDEGRAPMAAFGVTAEGAAPGGKVQASGSAQVKSYAIVDEQPAVISDRQVSPAEVGTQGIGCTVCELIVGELCSRAIGNVTSGYCIKVCLPLVSALWTFVVCSGACAVLIKYITNEACSIGSNFVCDQAGFC